VRLKALNKLSALGERSVIPEVETLLRDGSLEVRAEAVRYIYTYCETDPLTKIESLLDYPDHSIQGSVIVFLLKQGGEDNIPVAKMMLDHMLREQGAEGQAAKIEAAKVLGLIPPPSPLHDYLKELLQDPAPEVVCAALESAGKLQRRDLLPLLLDGLRSSQTRLAAREALVRYGPRILGTLRDHLQDTEVPVAVRQRLPRILGLIEAQESVNILLESLGAEEVEVRYKVVKALNRLRASGAALEFEAGKVEVEVVGEVRDYYRLLGLLAAYAPGVELGRGRGWEGRDLLSRALEERLEQSLERVFRLLGLIYPAGDIYQAYTGLRSEVGQVRANALELLDNLLRPSLKRALLPIIDHEVPLREKVEKGRAQWRLSAWSAEEAVGELISNGDRWVRVCAIYTAGERGWKGLEGAVAKLRGSGDALVSETADLTWSRLQTITSRR
jgi:AAA family ATP:ADP antiporter